MNLLEQCKLASAKLNELVEANKAKEIADNIRNRSNDLAETGIQLVDSSRRALILLDAGILNESQLADDSKLTQYLADVRQKLSNDPSSITSGHTFNYLKKAVEKYSEKTTEQVTEIWKEYVIEAAPDFNNKLLSQHRKTSFSDTVARIESDTKEAKRLARSAPIDAASFAELKTLWDSIRTDLASLPQADDPEVQAFLVAVGSEDGAELDMLTDSVKAWLLKYRMLEDFSVRRRR